MRSRGGGQRARLAPQNLLHLGGGRLANLFSGELDLQWAPPPSFMKPTETAMKRA